jgi:hypothetical protein
LNIKSKIKKAIVDKGYKVKGGIAGVDIVMPKVLKKVNTLLAAAAYNIKKWMSLKQQEILNLILRWIYQGLILAPVNIQC